MLSNYTKPDFFNSALISIDVQNDFSLPGAPAEIKGTYYHLPKMVKMVKAYRKLKQPIIHVVRIYLPDGSNADLCRRQNIKEGLKIAVPGSRGVEVVRQLMPNSNISLDCKKLLEGKIQNISFKEWVIYKPRWDAFYKTSLEKLLNEIKINTLVFIGCNFPNCPRATIYGASMRDFRIVMISDAVSGTYRRGLLELESIHVELLNAQKCIEWLNESLRSSD